MNVPILYVIGACLVCIVLGAVSGALWSRKHPAIVEAAVAEGKAIGTAAQSAANKDVKR